MHVAAIHFSWPWPRWQPHQLRYIEPELQKLNGPLIIAGDFNAAPWSNAVRRVEYASGARHLTGIGGTWMTHLLPVTLAPYIGLPIDQILVSPEIGGAKVSPARTPAPITCRCGSSFPFRRLFDPMKKNRKRSP